MEPILSDTKQFTANEKQLIALIFSCPFSEPLANCTLFQTRKIVKSDYQKAIESFDTEDINKLISEHEKCLFERVKSSDIESIKNSNHETNKKIAYLIWTGKGNLDFLTSELIKRRWIKSQNNFSKLFENKDENVKIFWNTQYQYELAYLLYRLKKDGFLRPVNTKGYFKVAEIHIVDYSGKSFTKNALVKNSSKILKNPKNYIDIISAVDNIMKAIS
ncbi:MAG: hypothetical protein HY951_14435 [Bacteroidia bacterium]|nr:hypothetical protein [Bacteroidia bacterium]